MSTLEASPLPTMRLVRQLQNAYDMTVLFVFADQVAERVHRTPDHLIAAGLQAGDFTREVTVRHHDGSVLVFEHAFTVTAGDHHAVFTEHNGYHVFHREDVTQIGEDLL